MEGHAGSGFGEKLGQSLHLLCRHQWIDAPHRVRAQERLAAKKARRTPYELSEPTWSEDDLPDDEQ